MPVLDDPVSDCQSERYSSQFVQARWLACPSSTCPGSIQLACPSSIPEFDPSRFESGLNQTAAASRTRGGMAFGRAKCGK